MKMLIFMFRPNPILDTALIQNNPHGPLLQKKLQRTISLVLLLLVRVEVITIPELYQQNTTPLIRMIFWWGLWSQHTLLRVRETMEAQMVNSLSLDQTWILLSMKCYPIIWAFQIKKRNKHTQISMFLTFGSISICSEKVTFQLKRSHNFADCY